MSKWLPLLAVRGPGISSVPRGPLPGLRPPPACPWPPVTEFSLPLSLGRSPLGTPSLGGWPRGDDGGSLSEEPRFQSLCKQLVHGSAQGADQEGRQHWAAPVTSAVTQGEEPQTSQRHAGSRQRPELGAAAEGSVRPELPPRGRDLARGPPSDTPWASPRPLS